MGRQICEKIFDQLKDGFQDTCIDRLTKHKLIE